MWRGVSNGSQLAVEFLQGNYIKKTAPNFTGLLNGNIGLLIGSIRVGDTVQQQQRRFE
jgi:hypothetical protein